MKTFDRGNFASFLPYEDNPSPVGFGSVCDAPHMHAVILELFLENIRKGTRFLDVGCGSGYLTCCFAHLCPDGYSYGIDHIESMMEFINKNIGKQHSNLLDDGRLIFRLGDARKGLP